MDRSRPPPPWCPHIFYLVFAATSFYFRSNFVFICSNILLLQQLLFLKQPLFVQQLLILLQHFFNFQHIKSNCSKFYLFVKEYLNLHQLLNLQQKLLLQQLLNLQRNLLQIAATFKMAPCPLWAAVHFALYCARREPDGANCPRLTSQKPPWYQISLSPPRVNIFIFAGKKIFGIFGDAFLWLNWQSSPFNDTFGVEKVKLAMYLLLLTWCAIGEKTLDQWSVI